MVVDIEFEEVGSVVVVVGGTVVDIGFPEEKLNVVERADVADVDVDFELDEADSVEVVKVVGMTVVDCSEETLNVVGRVVVVDVDVEFEGTGSAPQL